MKISGNEVIDPTFRGNMARLINHSCKPNCVTQKWHVLGEICVGIFALVDIKEGEELTFDYQFDIYSTAFTRCLCGAKECKGYLGVRPQDCTYEDWEEKLANLLCAICGITTEEDDEKLIMCDGCDEGFHTFCLSPPLTIIPESAWYCYQCLNLHKKEEETKKESCQKPESQNAETSWQMNKRLYDLACEKRRPSSDTKGPKKPSKELKKKKSLELKTEKRQEAEPAEDDDQPIKKRKSFENNTSKLPTTQQQLSDGMGKEDSGLTELASSNKLAKELKEMTLKLFNQLLSENPKFSQQIAEYNADKSTEIEKNVMRLNGLELEIVKRNQQILHCLGVKIFWDCRGSPEGDVFRKKYELTVYGNKRQFEGFEALMRLVLKSVANVEKAYGHVVVAMLIPAIYLKRLIGSSYQTL